MANEVYCPILKSRCIKQDLLLRKLSWPLTCKMCYVSEKWPFKPYLEKVPAGTL
ncbi:hypothetical protein ES702_06522 [subsurface metagenome]